MVLLDTSGNGKKHKPYINFLFGTFLKNLSVENIKRSALKLNKPDQNDLEISREKMSIFYIMLKLKKK